ncbi:MAG: hypothetical protein RID53_04155 [Coleofasciculus sp. B1-GNL1-01]|uniref:hypothetical protein n=1 Tax=Coleofasciculus sp. B1-GNL1-01 TaxID=3068484 RepID=UPI0032F61051
MPRLSALFTRPQVNSSGEDLGKKINSITKSSKLQQIFSQNDIEEALTERKFLEKWIEDNQTEVNNALQTIQLSMNNLFVAIGFINSIEATLRKAVIIAFLRDQNV